MDVPNATPAISCFSIAANFQTASSQVMEDAFSVTLTMSLLHEGYAFPKISSAIRLINLECVSNV